MIRNTAIAALLLLWVAPDLVQAESSVPGLVGTWVSVSGEVGHWSGTLKPFGEQVGTLVVEEQFGGIFRGTMSYDNESSGPEFEGRSGMGHLQSEPILGVIDWDNRSIVWVDYEDETVHRARLVNDNTLEAIAFEAGAHAVVNRMILVRQEDQAAPESP